MTKTDRECMSALEGALSTMVDLHAADEAFIATLLDCLSEEQRATIAAAKLMREALAKVAKERAARVLG
jgi:hypothetical protein